MARPSCLMLFRHCDLLAASRAAWTAGKSKAISTAMMAITTRSSIRVKPRWKRRLMARTPWGLGPWMTNEKGRRACYDRGPSDCSLGQVTFRGDRNVKGSPPTSPSAFAVEPNRWKENYPTLRTVARPHPVRQPAILGPDSRILRNWGRPDRVARPQRAPTWITRPPRTIRPRPTQVDEGTPSRNQKRPIRTLTRAKTAT